MVEDDDRRTRRFLLARYWESALGFWRTDRRRTAWLLTLAVISIALANLGLAYRMNVWHRVTFDALERRDGGVVLRQATIFFPLVLATVIMAASNTYSKMTLQREWRSWLNSHVRDQWLVRGRL